MKQLLLPALLGLSVLLTACNAAPAPPPPARSDSPANDSATRMDDQGAIIFEVTPFNLDPTVDTLEFDVVLTTHSIDLSMDLATTATLTTDTGVSVHSTFWDAPRGGHHVQGELIFPSTKDGKAILEGATKLTLTITDVDAPSRVFEWELK